LRDECSGADRRSLWAFLDDDFGLHIHGHDLGPSTAMVSPDGEYEWFQTVRAQHIPALLVLLGGAGTTDVLGHLERNYSGPASYELERVLREGAVPVELFVD
jgi:hypothetical protein